jgi:hypothetical protein
MTLRSPLAVSFFEILLRVIMDYLLVKQVFNAEHNFNPLQQNDNCKYHLL